jgi:hypothetical protein
MSRIQIASETTLEALEKASSKMVSHANLYLRKAFDKAWTYEEEESVKTADPLRDELIDILSGRIALMAQDRFWINAVPEIERLMGFAAGSITSISSADLAGMVKALDTMIHSSDYWAAVSNVSTSRAYQFGALTYFQEKQITRYMVSSILDTRICQVCLIMHGKLFEVQQAVDKMMRYRDSKDAGLSAEKEIFPFPKLENVDNISPEAVAASPFSLPPFHPRCRCLVLGASRRVEITEEPKVAETTPKPQPVLTEAQKKAMAFAAKHGEWTSEIAKKLAKKYGFSEAMINEIRSRIMKNPIAMNRVLKEKSSSFVSLKESGGFKNQFQIAAEGGKATSSGALTPYKNGARDEWEQLLSGGALQDQEAYKLLGFEDKLTKALADERPLYGYLDDIWNRDMDPTSHYGRVSFIMKEEVSARATWCFGNSSCLPNDLAGVMGTWENNTPLVQKWISNQYKEFVDKWQDSYDDFSDYMAYLLKSDEAGGPLKRIFGEYQYIEAQMYGGIDVARDVARIELRLNGADPAWYQHVIDWAEEIGLDVRLVDPGA